MPRRAYLSQGEKLGAWGSCRFALHSDAPGLSIGDRLRFKTTE
jgi:hypothetical protein